MGESWGLMAQNLQNSTIDHQPMSSTNGGSISVLHVDDDPDLTALTAHYLESDTESIEVVSEHSAQDALERLRTEDLDCVVSDYDMPGMDGVEFLRVVRDEFPDLPFILFTGKGSEDVASEAISAGVTDYLQKTHGTEQYELLANRIRNSVVHYWRARDLARYKTIVEAAGDGVYTLDPEGHFTQVNDYVVERTGYSREELIGSHVSLVLSDTDVEKGAAAIEELLENEEKSAVTREMTVHMKSAFTFPIELTIGLLPKRDGRFQGTVGIARDITARKRAESRFESLFENIPDPAVLVEFRDDEPLIESVNEAFETTFGYPADVAVGQSVNDLIVPESDDNRKRAREVDAQVQSGESVEREVRRETAAGEVREFLFRNAVIEAHDEPTGAHFGVYTDITERKQNKRELREEQAFTDSLLDALPDVYYLLDEEGGMWRWNDRLGAVTGYTDEEIDEMHALEFIPEEDQGRIMDAMLEVYNGAVETRETAFVTKSGDRIPFELNGAPVRDANGTIIGLVGTGRDISARKERERQLERYERMLNVLPDGVCAFDEDGYITVVNDRLVSRTGESRSSLLGEHVSTAFTSELVEQGQSAVRTLLDQDERDTTTLEATIDQGGAETYPAEIRVGLLYDESDEYDGNVAVVRDISERERLKRRHRALVENSPTTISVLNPDWTIQYVSPAMEEGLGHAPADIVGMNAFEFVHPEDQEAVRETFQSVVENPDESRSVELRFRDAAGDWQWIKARGTNRLDDPAVEGIVVNTEVVTDRVEREAELQRQNEHLEEFTSVVSHDLRNPLNVISGGIELARESCAEEDFDRIDEACDRMEQLIENLLTLARMGQTIDQRSEVALSDPVEAAWETVAPESATLIPALDSLTVEGDEERLRQVFENLFTNAVSQAGPDVTVRVGALADGKGWYVGDDGPGIPPGDREKVFEKGYTTAANGTGYGLAIVESVIAAHGWDITVTESKDGGARFVVTDVAGTR